MARRRSRRGAKAPVSTPVPAPVEAGGGEGDPSTSLSQPVGGEETAGETALGAEQGETGSPVAEGDRLLAKAQALAQAGEPEAAADLIQEVLKERPAELSARFALGHIYDRRGDYVQALEQYEAARALDPDNVAVLSKIGVVLAALGRFDQAEREL